MKYIRKTIILAEVEKEILKNASKILRDIADEWNPCDDLSTFDNVSEIEMLIGETSRLQ